MEIKKEFEVFKMFVIFVAVMFDIATYATDENAIKSFKLVFESLTRKLLTVTFEVSTKVIALIFPIIESTTLKFPIMILVEVSI